MRIGIAIAGTGLLLAIGSTTLFAEIKEDFKNDKVAVTEETLAPGEHEQVAGHHPSAVVYLAGYEAQIKFADGKTKREPIVRGEALREPAEAAVLVNAGKGTLRLVRVEFLTAGGDEMWGREGFAPRSQMIFEDQYSRTYNMRVAARAGEPMHSHHGRVVVCLSGARLEHTLPDGSVQPTTLKTDEVSWRPAQTHKGINRSDTDLWVVAVEPK